MQCCRIEYFNTYKFLHTLYTYILKYDVQETQKLDAIIDEFVKL